MNNNRFVMERKWKNFGHEVSDYFRDKTRGIFLTEPRIIIPKHFADRVMDRVVKKK